MLSALIVAAALAGSPVMNTTGNIHISLAEGHLEGAVCIDNWPEGITAISLHGGLNLAHVRDAKGGPVPFNGWYNAAADGEGRLYDIEPPKSGPVCFDYVGALPVFRKHDAIGDFKGMIAFDGDSLRATEQSVWLPTPFDGDKKVRLQKTAYRLHVKCDDCAFLYMNGAAPVAGREATFASTTSQEPLLFAGKGGFERGQAMSFINAQPKASDGVAVNAVLNDLRRYYAEYLAQPSDDTPVLLRFDPIDGATNPRHSWGFSTWPTISFSRNGFDKMIVSLPRHDKEGDESFAYLAHEAAHYYFGGLRRPSGPYMWWLIETTAEFMSIQALADLRGQDAVQAHIAPLIAQIDKHTASRLPLDQVTETRRIGEEYRYVYGPLLLMTLDRKVGGEKMRRFMRGLLNDPEPQTWSDLTHIALKAGITDADWGAWTKRCVDGTDSLCIDELAAHQARPQ